MPQTDPQVVFKEPLSLSHGLLSLKVLMVALVGKGLNAAFFTVNVEVNTKGLFRVFIIKGLSKICFKELKNNWQ